MATHSSVLAWRIPGTVEPGGLPSMGSHRVGQNWSNLAAAAAAALFASILSHFVGCIFILFMVSFSVQKLLTLIRSHLLIFVFIYITLGNRSKKVLSWFMSKSVLPIFSSKSFIVPGLTCKSLIHFRFIFVYGVRECSIFTLVHVSVQFSQHHLLKTLSFLPCIFLPHLW